MRQAAWQEVVCVVVCVCVARVALRVQQNVFLRPR